MLYCSKCGSKILFLESAKPTKFIPIICKSCGASLRVNQSESMKIAFPLLALVIVLFAIIDIKLFEMPYIYRKILQLAIGSVFVLIGFLIPQKLFEVKDKK